LSEGITEDRVSYQPSLELRYLRQYHEVNVPATWDEIMSGDFSGIVSRFHTAHDTLYGYSLEDKGTPVELINMRLVAVGDTEKPSLSPEPYAGLDPKAALKGTRLAYLPNEKHFADINVYDGMKLQFGNRLDGPVIIEQVNTTTFVTPEFSVVVDQLGTYTIYLREREEEVLARVLGEHAATAGGVA
jgi:N-methylhydantoinase A